MIKKLKQIIHHATAEKAPKRFQVESVRELCWTADKSGIDMVVKFNHLPVEIPFTAHPHDREQHGRDLFTLAKLGEFGPVA